MAFSITGSAIDDSFDPTFFAPSPRQAGSVRGSDSQHHFNGPRSGHWTVSSSLGSAIDDRCATVWGSGDGIRVEAQTQAHAQPIAGSLLRKLAKASLEKHNAVEVQAATHEAVENQTSQRGQSLAKAPSAEQDTRPKGFYVPRMKDTRGVDIARRSSQSKVGRGAQVQPEPSKRQDEQQW